MNRMQRMLVALLLFVSAAPAPAPAASTAGGEVEAVAVRFLDLLVAEDFDGAVATFDATMTGVMPAAKLCETWAALLAQVGPYRAHRGTRTEKIQGYDAVFLTCEFGRATLDVKVVLDRSRKVAGLFFVPTQAAGPAPGYQAPDYVDKDSFAETEVVVGTAPWVLPATLTVPRGEGPFAGVVLVHGSGPQDRDETIGPSKPFRDLAWGLASAGIAVLRYEKRTKQHGARMAELAGTLTVEQETVADAVAAAELLRVASEVDPGRIFVLGHSLGGMAAPRIGERAPWLAGLIVLAGSARPLEDLALEQFEYIFGLDGQVTDEEAAQLEQLRAQVQRVKSAELTAATPAAELPLGVPASYWLDLRGYEAAKAAARLEMPLFVLQGGRDYQVTMADFALWQEALRGRPDVRCEHYPALNHLFMAGKGRSTPAEYERVGHVSAAVIRDIAGWIGDLAGE